jgi:hypothetical protein
MIIPKRKRKTKEQIATRRKLSKKQNQLETSSKKIETLKLVGNFL